MDFQEIARNLRRLQDEADIIRLKSRYFNAGDTQDFDILGDCFTEDAVIEYPPFPVFHGGSSLSTTFERTAAEMPAINVHQGHNPDIRFLDEDIAEGTWNLYFFAYFPGSGKIHHSSGLYHDRYVRTVSGWKISHSRAETRITLQAAIGSGDAVSVEIPAQGSSDGEVGQS